MSLVRFLALLALQVPGIDGEIVDESGTPIDASKLRLRIGDRAPVDVDINLTTPEATRRALTVQPVYLVRGPDGRLTRPLKPEEE